jgi:hypothetical protein
MLSIWFLFFCSDGEVRMLIFLIKETWALIFWQSVGSPAPGDEAPGGRPWLHASAGSAVGAQVEWVREVVAQAAATLMSCPANMRDVKKDEKSVPNLVHLLDLSPWNTAKKYAISCLLSLSATKCCKKLSEIDVADAEKLLEKLERSKLWNLFSRNCSGSVLFCRNL